GVSFWQTPNILESEDSLDLMSILGNFSYDFGNSSEPDYEATPCHNHYCPLFQRVAPIFLAITCVLATLATSTLLVALAKMPQAWSWPHSRVLVAQLGVAMALFTTLLPPLALGIGKGWGVGRGLCSLT
ncbi:ACKR1 protein, partial [Turnix velox]|nr:ACKR1 protein [Turnix velox]